MPGREEGEGQPKRQGTARVRVPTIVDIVVRQTSVAAMVSLGNVERR